MSKVFVTLGWVLMLGLAACSGGGSNPNQETLFTQQNAWTGGIPSDAQQVSPEEFRQRVNSGELVLDATANQQASKTTRQRQYQADLKLLQSIPNPTTTLQGLVQEAASKPDFEGDRPASLPGGKSVLLFGTGTQLRSAADAYRRSQSLDNALSVYSLSYWLLSDNLKTQLPTPDSLKGKALAEVNAASQQLETLLGQNPQPQMMRLESSPTAPRRGIAGGVRALETLNPGDGSDQDSTCNAPSNYAANYWFALKNFISPIKDQFNRGTCWAFSAIGAVESRELVQNNNPVNLSEQFLINKVKHDWDNADDDEGYLSGKALDSATSRNQALLSEAGWTYNRALNRDTKNFKQGDIGSYSKDCDGYGGTCSRSSHESRQVCTSVVFDFCSYSEAVFSGSGVQASSTAQVWSSGNPFNLNTLTSYLNNGYVLLASFPVYRGFYDDVKSDGVVSNYSPTKLDKDGNQVSGSYGGHAVQIVGFLPNAKLQPNPNAGGGGYFIVKNSWGCAVGDGGYYYVPVNYVITVFNSLSVLNFDTRRSDVWKQDQAAPQISLKTNPLTADLGAPTDLAAAFTVTHPVFAVKTLNLSVTSDKDGLLYNGSWSVNSLSSGSLKQIFNTLGTRTLTLVANYNGNTAQATLSVNVQNLPPSLSLQYSGAPQQGVPFPISALVSDPVDSNAYLCQHTAWSVDSPDQLSSSSGCSVLVTFNSPGSRQVRVYSANSRGAQAAQTINLTVTPPPINPYPKLTGFGVSSNDSLGGCTNVVVPSGNTINLTDLGCGPRVLTLPRYAASVTVENPSNEALTYDWVLYIGSGNGESVYDQQTGSSGNYYSLSSKYRNGQVTTACRVTAKVNAPDASRSKGPVTVWTGQCTLNTVNIN